jgi:hypothetical protein
MKAVRPVLPHPWADFKACAVQKHVIGRVELSRKGEQRFH